MYNTHIPPRFRIHALFSTLYIGHIFHSFIFRNEIRCFCHQKTVDTLTVLLYYLISTDDLVERR